MSEPVAGAASPPAEITFPDGTTLATDSAEAARRLGELAGRAGLAPRARPRGNRSGAAADDGGGIAGGPARADGPPAGRARGGHERVHARAAAAAAPGQLLRRVLAPPAHPHDPAQTLARLAPESDWDERRFRPNLLVESDDRDGFPELAWLGRRLRVGGALIDVVMGCPRCVMVTLAGDGLPQDPRIMRTLVRETQHTAGIYASVVEEGNVREGDPIELLD